MRIAEAFSKMRLSEYCSAQDIDRAIAVTVDSFVGSQKVSCKKALARAFAKYDTYLRIFQFKANHPITDTLFLNPEPRVDDGIEGVACWLVQGIPLSQPEELQTIRCNHRRHH